MPSELLCGACEFEADLLKENNNIEATMLSYVKSTQKFKAAFTKCSVLFGLLEGPQLPYELFVYASFC